MADVVDLDRYRAERAHAPYLAGKCCCMQCHHTWVGTASGGTLWLECPECHAMKGMFIHHMEHDDVPLLHCLCGNWVMLVYHDHLLCPACGAEMDRDA